MRWDLVFIEFAAVALFFFGIFHFRKQEKGRSIEFFMMAIYGLILEELDMRIFKSYQYSPHFNLTFMSVPVSIALLWAVILAGSMAITDRLGLPKKVRPFMDAILAVWIDLSLDAIAIRLHYWTWNIPENEGWFGVPAGNLYAWMWVAFAYSFLARWVREKIKNESKWIWLYLLLPLLAYGLLFVCMATVGILGKMAGLESENQKLFIFAAQFLVFVGIVFRAWPQGPSSLQEPRRLSRLWIWSRLSMHVYFFAAYFIIGAHISEPLLGLLAAVIFIGELFFLAWHSFKGTNNPLRRRQIIF